MVRPVLVHPTGFRMSPYADIKPAGDDAATAARRAASAPPRTLALQPRQLWPLKEVNPVPPIARTRAGEPLQAGHTPTR